MKPIQPNRRELLAVSGAIALGTMLPAVGSAKDTPPMLPLAKPEEIGLNRKQLQVAYDLLEKWTTGPKPQVPGGAILVGRNGKQTTPVFYGKQRPDADAPAIRQDSMFLMASITKPLVYMGAMILVERGLLNLSDPVVRYVPEFKEHDKSEVRVRHLFTHTSGLPDMPPNNFELRKQQVPLKRYLEAASQETTLAFKPGTKLSYQSMGTAVVTDIVQRLSGQTIAEFLKKEIFEPLLMKSTGLGAAGLDRKRIVHVQTPDYQSDINSNWNSVYWQDLGCPWGGLYSTPDDFAKICQLLLNKGTLNKTRILSPASVKMMTTNRLADYPDLPESVIRTQPWGLGWRMNHPGMADSWYDLLSRDVFGHTGATGTTVWMDPASQTFCILLTSAIREKAPWLLVHLSNAIAAAIE